MTQENAHELMLEDSVFELLAELREAPSQNEFDRGYRQGFARVLHVLKLQAEAFGINVGLADFDPVDWSD